MYENGRLLEEGIKIQLNNEKLLKYYEKAAHKGHERALKAQERILDTKK